MAKISKVRPVILSARYEDPSRNMEALLHLPGGYRSCGMVEITLEDGTTGLGEGYLAVFAPEVFSALIRLLEPYLVGKDVHEHKRLMKQLSVVTGYWSLQGAAQHAISAIDIALFDCRSKLEGSPLFKFLGGENRPIKLYASGGDAIDPAAMEDEMAAVQELGIDLLKIRARNNQVEKAVWCQKRGAAIGIGIAVDMTQNLAIPSQTVEEAQRFVDTLKTKSGEGPVFLEEAMGPEAIEGFNELRKRLKGITKVAGGEIVTTCREMFDRIERGCYDIVQPDATVIGGIAPVMEIYKFCHARNTEVYVHCWGGPVGMMANYHAAMAEGDQVVEWPMTRYALRDAMLVEPWTVDQGLLKLSDTPGLGVVLTKEIEESFPFRPDAVYACVVDPAKIPDVSWH